MQTSYNLQSFIEVQSPTVYSSVFTYAVIMIIYLSKKVYSVTFRQSNQIFKLKKNTKNTKIVQ